MPLLSMSRLFINAGFTPAMSTLGDNSSCDLPESETGFYLMYIMVYKDIHWHWSK